MKSTRTIVNSAIAGVLALGVFAAADQAMAAKKGKFEKCAGIVKATKNDCGTSITSCAGSIKVDNHAEAWIYVPKGTCGKIAGGRIQTSKYAKVGGKGS